MAVRALIIGTCLAISAAYALADSKDSVENWPDDYDEMFRKQAKHYFGPGQDWRWFKAQAVAESGLDPQAKSKSGAIGIMQILPSTFKEIQEENPHLKDIGSPRWNIAAGIYYDRILFNRWKTPPNDHERLLFAFGSYNAGYRRILKSVKRARADTTSWTLVKKHVPGQTRHYVYRIRKLMGQQPAGSG